MKIAVTKVFAEYINTVAKQTGKKFAAEIITLPEYAYTFFVGSDIFTAYEFGDVNRDGKYKAIVIRYPSEFYAAEKYLSTYYLTKEFRRREVKTATELQDMILDLCEV